MKERNLYSDHGGLWSALRQQTHVHKRGNLVKPRSIGYQGSTRLKNKDGLGSMVYNGLLFSNKGTEEIQKLSTPNSTFRETINRCEGEGTQKVHHEWSKGCTLVSEPSQNLELRTWPVLMWWRWGGGAGRVVVLRWTGKDEAKFIHLMLKLHYHYSWRCHPRRLW